MVNLLAIESSAESCSAALCVGGQEYSRIFHEPRQHAQRLLPMVDELLGEAGISLKQLDGLAFGRGPGSFTGVRISISVIQGLALGAELPVVPVSTLQALAMAAQRSGVAKVGETVHTAFDARMQEVYSGRYRLTNALPEPLTEEAVLPVASVDQWLTEQSDVAVGSGWRLPPLAANAAAKQYPDMSVSALDILAAAQLLWHAGQRYAVDDVQAVYLRNEITWQKRQSIRHSESST